MVAGLLAVALAANAPAQNSEAGDDLLLEPPQPAVEQMKPAKSLHLMDADPRAIDPVDPRNSFGATPVADEKTARRYGEVVSRTVEPETTLDLVVGRPRLLVFNARPVRIQIPGEETATYTIISERELSVNGLQPGTTTLNVWFEKEGAAPGENVLSYLVRVIPDPEARAREEGVYAALQDEVNAAFPESKIELSLVGGKLLVRGQAKDLVDAAQILRVLEENAPAGATDVPVGAPQVQFNIDNPAAADLPAIRQYVLGGHRSVINRLVIPGEQQVMLRVTIAEVNRSAARSLGFAFQFIDDAPGIGNFANTTGGSALGAGSNLAFSYIGDHTFRAALTALRQNDLAKTLAEPSLVTLNGQPAEFRTGGSFPVPVVTGATSEGLQGVQFEEFGVSLAFTPWITDRDNIRLTIDTEVSNRNSSGGSTIGNTEVPGLDQRTFNTTVELREGQTLAIAGIMQTTYKATSKKIPFFGDLPIIGPLLGGQETANAEQELVVLVTPELVTALDKNQIAAAALPGHEIYEPDDWEFFFLGRQESRAPRDFRSAVQSDFGRLRHRRLEQVFIRGPIGHAKVREERY